MTKKEYAEKYKLIMEGWHINVGHYLNKDIVKNMNEVERILGNPTKNYYYETSLLENLSSLLTKY